MRRSEHEIFICGRGARRRSDMELDPFEASVLAVARHVFETFDRPERQCWMSTFWLAEQRFPPPFGATIAHALVVAIEAIRTNRLRNFTYIQASDPTADALITAEERYFVLTLRMLRRDDATAARLNALMLCDGGDTGPLLAALERLSIITGDVEQTVFQPLDGRRPTGRAK